MVWSKLLSLGLVALLAVGAPVAALAEQTIESTDEASLQPVVEDGFVFQVPGTNLEISLPVDFAVDTSSMTEEELAEGLVARLLSDENPVDFDVFVYPSNDQWVGEYITEDIKKYDASFVYEWYSNGLDVYRYGADEERDGVLYGTHTFIVDLDEQYVEIVAWTDGSDEQEDFACEVFLSAVLVPTEVIELGSTGMTMALPAEGFRLKELTVEDLASNKGLVSGYDNWLLSLSDVAVWELAKDGLSLEEFAAQDSADQIGTAPQLSTVNGIEVARYHVVLSENARVVTIVVAEAEDAFLRVAFYQLSTDAFDLVESCIATLS